VYPVDKALSAAPSLLKKIIMRQLKITGFIFSMWNRLPLIVRAVLSGCFVSSIGVGVWGAMLSRFPSVWVILPMPGALWLFWKFFSGAWGTGSGAATRRVYFRPTILKPSVWKPGIIGAILFVVIVQASFVITFRIIEFPAAKFTADYKILDSFPLWAAWVLIIMSSVVAGICEEAGFRGYMQFPLEKKYGPVAAIILTSIVFTCIHFGHTWAWPILPHIFFASVLLGILAYKCGSLIPGIIGHSILDVFDYSVWWSDITGGFTKRTIFKTGIDIHFIAWALVLLFAVYGFFRITGKLSGGGKKSGLQAGVEGTEIGQRKLSSI
jgi:membrane protease YdiL (CAAX protease family)